MGFFKKSTTNVAVLDIHSSSIGAAYATYDAKGIPTVVYSVRMPLEPHATEPTQEALARTLDLALRQLVTEGSPLLRAKTGSGRTDFALATIAAPWQQSMVFSRVIEHEKPFLFTKQILNDAVDSAGSEVAPDAVPHTKVSDMLIATLLNGYEIENPFGKRAKRAELILLSSSVETEVMQLVNRAVRKGLHQHQIAFNAFLPEAYVAMRDLYPQQRDFLVLDVGGEATDILLAKHGLLISLTNIPHGVNEMARVAREGGVSSPAVPMADGNILDTSRNTSFATKVADAENAWIAQMHAALGEVARQEPLPRTVFLLADESVRDFLRRLLDCQQLRTLWLSDEALSILPIVPQQFAPYFTEENAEGVDPALALLTLAAKNRLDI